MMFQEYRRGPTTNTGLALLVTLAITLLGHPLAGVAQTLPELPRVYLDTTYAAPTGGVAHVGAGEDLQAALNQAQPGDVIQLQAGAVFTGNFTLPYKTGGGWIYIQSSALASLPPPGSRVAPAHASLMPKIVTPNASPALSAAAGAHHYRLVGVEITGTLADTSSIQYNLVAFGSGNDFVVDRCFIHGTPNGNYKRGVELNNSRTAVVDSYLSEFHSLEEGQAILGWNGWGPFKIVNNYVEGAGENLMFGGADPSAPNLVPADIEIRRNYFFKPLTWKVGHPSYAGINWVVKNNLELKNARRVLIDGNIFENNWQDDQFGTAILFTVRNQGGAAPWSTVEDVTFTKNIVRRVAGAIGMLGRDNINQSQQSARFLVQNNLLVDINSAYGNLLGRILDTGNGVVDLVIEHNTGFMDQKIMTAASSPNTLFVYRDNLTPRGVYGFIGDGTSEGLNTLNAYFPSAVFARNILAGGNPSLYPADNFFPISLDNVGFVDLTGGNYRLAASSPYRNAGTDGKDIGADIDAIEAATAGVGPPAPSTSPIGVHDVADPSSIAGWACDPDNFTLPLSIQLYRDGPIGGGGILVTSVSANQPREPAVGVLCGGNANHGFFLPTPASLKDGQLHSIYAYAINIDAAGNPAGLNPLLVNSPKTIVPPDATPPTIAITSPTSSSTYSTSTTPLTLGGTASDNIGVIQVTWATSRGGSGTATGTTSWTASGIALQPGSNVLTVTARDAAGNAGTATLTVTLTDTTAPTVTITAPTSNPTYTTSSSSLTLGGIASDNVGVTQVTWANDRGGSGAATGTTSWTASAIVLQLGANVLTITARDAAGNTARATLTVTRTASSFTFTDDPLVAQSTGVKAAHIVEIRAAVDSLRVARGLTPFVWTDPTLTPASSQARVTHFSELRTALDQAYQAAGRALPTYTDPTLTPGQTVVKAAHLTELRAAARALQ